MFMVIGVASVLVLLLVPVVSLRLLIFHHTAPGVKNIAR
jgi:hypothetical protein